MTKIVQISGGVATSQNAYIGPEREVTAVTDSHELRLHDGATVGGFRFLPKDVNDLIYQGKSSELDALSELGQIRGLLVRTGAATFVARKVLGTTNEITVTNQDGFSGDIQVGLPTSIDKAGLSFVQSVSFSNGLAGNLTGDVVGNITGNLTGDATGNHSGAFAGDVDVRGSTLQLDDGQIPISKLASTPVLVGSEFLVPSGGIIMWSGSVASIPAGWVLCDGNNGTPDLRDQFVVGASTTGAHAVGDSGGSDTHNHIGSVAPAGQHSHAITVNDHVLTLSEIPSHEHGAGFGTNQPTVALWGSRAATGTRRFDNNTSAPDTEPLTDSVGGGNGHSHTASSDLEADHSHGVTVNNQTVLPPFYALAFIMKT